MRAGITPWSVSHRWDGHGLWSSTGIRFSRHGTLVETMAQLVDAAAGGWVSAELEDVLGVRVHAALLSLYRRGRVLRHQIGGEYLYVSVHDGSAQLAHRQQQVQAEAVSFMGLGLEAGPASPPAGLSGDPQRKAAASVCRVRVAASGSRRRHHRRGLDRAQRQDRGSGTAGIAQRWRFHRSRPRCGSRATGIKKNS